MNYFNENEQFGGAFSFLGSDYDQGIGEALMMGRGIKPDPGFVNGSGFEMSYPIPRTASCPPAVAAAMAEVAKNKGKDSAITLTGRESFKKRKSDNFQSLKIVAEEKSKEKKIRGCDEEEGSKSTITTSSNNKKGPSSDNNPKASDIPKPDYIHVRARRGQATDSHSLAERVRREKISERMKYLQDLVPGCNKITGKAGMLDEIINYVHSLQRQVEFLSMKLAVINPPLEFDAENYLAKEMFPACTSSIPTIGASSEMVNPSQVQFNTLGQGASCSGLHEIGASSEMVNPSSIAEYSSDFTLRRTISAPVPVPGTLLDSSCLNQNQYVTWDAELQNHFSMEYQQGRSSSPSFISQPFTGYVETGHVKLEM